jgi:hypothetical protein
LEATRALRRLLRRIFGGSRKARATPCRSTRSLFFRKHSTRPAQVMLPTVATSMFHGTSRGWSRNYVKDRGRNDGGSAGFTMPSGRWSGLRASSTASVGTAALARPLRCAWSQCGVQQTPREPILAEPQTKSRMLSRRSSRPVPFDKFPGPSSQLSNLVRLSEQRLTRQSSGDRYWVSQTRDVGYRRQVGNSCE